MPDQAPSDDWIQSALKVTGHFEDSADPLGAVTGDFDHMGISLGVLQWNIGQGSLQPLVKNVGQDVVTSAMPQYGRELWNACNVSIAAGLQIVRGWQNGDVIGADVRAELEAFTHGSEFVDQQIRAAHKVATRAYAEALDWARLDNQSPVPPKRLFCWLFDLLTQNGGLKTVTHDGTMAYINGGGAQQAVNTICDWLAARTAHDAGFKDSRRNAALWRQIPEDRLIMFVASYLRSQLSKQAYRGDTLNRKATIAIGHGWVHGELHNLTTV